MLNLYQINKNEFKTDEFNFPQKLLNDISWNFINPALQLMINKIDNNSLPLEGICLVGKGMETAANEIFTFNKEKIEKYKIELKWFKKRLQNSLIKRYYFKPYIDYLLYLENMESFEELPNNIQTYLKENEKVLKNRAVYKRGDIDWWRFSFPIHKDFYKHAKLITSYRNSQNSFMIDEKTEYLGLTDTTIIFQQNNSYLLKYILGLLNSKVLDFRFKKMAKLTGKNIYEYFENVISRIPIYKIDFSKSEEKKKHDNLVNLVDKILELNKQLQSLGDKITDERKKIEEEIKNTDTQIDQLVYSLYDLTSDEIKIIEGN